MKAKGKKIRNLGMHGMLSLEAALVFPFVLVIVLFFLGAIHGVQDAMILSHALDQTSREIALLLPLADLFESFADPVSRIKEIIPDETLADLALDGLSDVAATVLASPFILQRLDRWAQATAHSQGRKPPAGARRLAVDFDNDRQTIWLCLSFEQTTLLTREWTEIKSRVPVWNTFQAEQAGGGDDSERDGIWELTNFERGQTFRRIFGGHLPHFYPVIACWNGFEAVSIKSMDLTAPSWSSPAAADRRINQLVDSLAAFEGIGGEGPAPGQVMSRRLILVIPDNQIVWKTPQLLRQWIRQAQLADVTLDIREYGTSHAYQQSDWLSDAP
ncbi:MAG: hypothetical protein GX838_00735 [Clostridiaceae bacterium]|nr:hypothetical protein [Clostridiaceae bacterium]